MVNALRRLIGLPDREVVAEERAISKRRDNARTQLIDLNTGPVSVLMPSDDEIPVLVPEDDG